MSAHSRVSTGQHSSHAYCSLFLPTTLGLVVDLFIQEWANYHLSLWLSSHCLSPQQLFPKLAMCLALIGVHHLMLSILPPISLLYAAVSLYMKCSEDMSPLWSCYIQHRKGNDFELVISTLYCTGIFLDHPWRPVKVII